MPFTITEESDFVGGKKASINPEACTRCGRCVEVCRFGAISEEFVVDEVACEGCGACYFLCPAGAVDFTPRTVGCLYSCDTERGDRFIYAELSPGEENSGKLVAYVRQEAKNYAEKSGKKLILIDGPPGIGCPVISSVTGTDMAIIVTEPTPTGMHDLTRILGLARHFGIIPSLVVNRCDINEDYLHKMRAYCEKEQVHFLGEIPYNPLITEAQREAKTILEYAPDCDASIAIRKIHKKLESLLEESNHG